jgi:adenylate cyclase
MALGMRNVVRRLAAAQGWPVRVRIGIHSGGPVVAGVIGRRKFAYDVWGDVVNTASRMESHGVADEIQVSEATYARLKDSYLFEDRGVIEIKGKPPMRTYLLVGHASDDGAQETTAPASGTTVSSVHSHH